VKGAKAALTAARNKKIPTVLDADTAPLDTLRTLVPLADFVIFSESGLNIYTEGMKADGWRCQYQAEEEDCSNKKRKRWDGNSFERYSVKIVDRQKKYERSRKELTPHIPNNQKKGDSMFTEIDAVLLHLAAITPPADSRAGCIGVTLGGDGWRWTETEGKKMNKPRVIWREPGLPILKVVTPY